MKKNQKPMLPKIFGITLSEDKSNSGRVEIHNYKIVPNLYNKSGYNSIGVNSASSVRLPMENEWEQEYYIIYHSYVLEENDF